MEKKIQIAIGILIVIGILILSTIHLPGEIEGPHSLIFHSGQVEGEDPLDITEIEETDPEKIILITQSRLKALEEYGITVEEASKYNCIKFLFKDVVTPTHTYEITSKIQNTTGTMERRTFETQVGSTEYIAIEQKTALTRTINNETFIENTIVTSYSLLNADSCVFKKRIIVDEGKDVQVNRMCKEEKDGSYKTCYYDVKLIRKEVLDLPAGVFNTTVFRVSIKNTTYWDAGLAFPVKIEDDNSIYELIKYESQ